MKLKELESKWIKGVEKYKKFFDESTNIIDINYNAGVLDQLRECLIDLKQLSIASSARVGIGGVCPRCGSKEYQTKPITHDCYECGATWQTPLGD